MAEVTYFSNAEVQITNARAVLQEKTYVVANISSVGHEVDRFPKVTCWILGGLCLFLAIVFRWMLLIATPLLLLAWFGKHKHILIITGSGGESRAFATRDLDYFHAIKRAVEDAIISRSK